MNYNFFKIIKFELLNGFKVFMSLSEDNEKVSLDNEFYNLHKQVGNLTAITNIASFGVDNSEIEILFQKNGVFTKQNFERGVLNDCKFTIYKIERNNFEIKDGVKYYNLNSAKIELTGLVGNFEISFSSVNIELRSIKQLLTNSIVNTIKRYCNNNFCDNNCTLKIENFTYKTTVEKINSQTSLTIQKPENISLKTEENKEEFLRKIRFGRLDVKNGILKNFKIDIKFGEILDNNLIKLYLNTNVQVLLKNDEEVNLVLQCDKTKEVCKTYNNFQNFRGFSYVPVKSKVYATGIGNVVK